jgi:hypothetical protein
MKRHKQVYIDLASETRKDGSNKPRNIGMKPCVGSWGIFSWVKRCKTMSKCWWKPHTTQLRPEYIPR